jgi:hypothetical protein
MHSYLSVKWVISFTCFFTLLRVKLVKPYITVREMQFHTLKLFCFSLYALFFIGYLATWSQHSHCNDTLFATNLNFKILFLKAVIELLFIFRT